MKKIWAVLILVLILVLPLCLAGAQEAASPAAAPSDAAGTTDLIEGAKSAAAPWINKIIGLLAPIGALFGKATGIRIGGTTGTGIAALALAKVVENKAPSWVKWVLYLTGGTMFAGGGANVAQLVMQNILQ